jgi:8-oxo-dGTP pyrophosphatase MutT (NUDIX family)
MEVSQHIQNQQRVRLHVVRKRNNPSRKQKIKCGGIIFNSTLDKIIIVLGKYSIMDGDPKWGLPKGQIEKHETLTQCAIREIKEETGITVNIHNDSPKIIIDNTHYFIVQVDDDVKLEPIDKKEIADIKWVDIKDLHKYSGNRGLRKLRPTVAAKILFRKRYLFRDVEN